MSYHVLIKTKIVKETEGACAKHYLGIENTSQVAPCYSKVWPCFNGFQVTSLREEGGGQFEAIQPSKFGVNDAAPGF